MPSRLAYTSRTMFFIELLKTDPYLYLSLLIGMIFSIVLHELAHGYVAIKLGDDTPIRLNRMTFNPMVNLGLFSMILLAVMGMGWGSMPVDSSRLRGRYADMWVSLAGPATNFLLSIFFIILLLAIMYGQNAAPEARFPYEKSLQFCFWMAMLNIVLGIFNLFPVYPLDGCRALMCLDYRFRNFVENNPGFQQFGIIGAFIIVNILSSQGLGLFALASRVIGSIVYFASRFMP